MSALRLLGGAAALAFFLLSIRRYGRRRTSRFSLIISCVLAVAVLALAISPSLFNPIFDTFNFGARNIKFGRLIFVLMIAVIVAFIVEVARGHSGEPYDWLGAIAGLAYIAAVIVLRVRG